MEDSWPSVMAHLHLLEEAADEDFLEGLDSERGRYVFYEGMVPKFPLLKIDWTFWVW